LELGRNWRTPHYPLSLEKMRCLLSVRCQRKK
jgi:hypothetical protein